MAWNAQKNAKMVVRVNLLQTGGENASAPSRLPAQRASSVTLASSPRAEMAVCAI